MGKEFTSFASASGEKNSAGEEEKEKDKDARSEEICQGDKGSNQAAGNPLQPKRKGEYRKGRHWPSGNAQAADRV